MPYDRKRYAEDPAYREKTLADRRAHYKANSEWINEGRRRRYATDADYRAKVLADNRKTSRAHRLQRSYGISLQHYDRMFARQRGMCLICWKTFDRSLCVDHSGDTGMVRALLCTSCNVGFGNFFENPRFCAEPPTTVNSSPRTYRRSYAAIQPRCWRRRGCGPRCSTSTSRACCRRRAGQGTPPAQTQNRRRARPLLAKSLQRWPFRRRHGVVAGHSA